MTATSPPAADLGSVLIEFAIAHPKPDAEALEAYCHLYPGYSGDLTSLAVDLVLMEPESAVAPIEESDAGLARALSSFRTRYEEVENERRRAAAAARVQCPDPFAGLDAQRFGSAARGLRANKVFLARVRDRLIRFETYPTGFLRMLAEELRASLDAVSAYLRQPPQIAAGTSFKARQKPEAAAQQTFEEAMESSRLPQEDREFLANL